ncbi:MAG: Uma2 family endonuclease [Bryobacteraceae bacterium]
MAAKTTISLDEFLKLPEFEEDGTHYELDEGELITLSPSGGRHAIRVQKTFRYLMRYLPEEQYDILPGEVGFIMSYDPRPTVRGANLAVVRHREEYPEGMLKEPALLVVEVVSPSNTPDDIERKRIQYLEFGVQEVWVVYEKAKTIHVSLNPAAARDNKQPESFVANIQSAFTSTLGFPVVAKDLFR